MATNSFDALVVDVNKKISEMNTAASNANSAAAAARNAVNAATSATQAANAATEAANNAAGKANSEADAWDKAAADAKALGPGENPTVAISEENGAKKLSFGIPAGLPGKDGPTGPAGKSGVTFTLSGTTLYITTN